VTCKLINAVEIRRTKPGKNRSVACSPIAGRPQGRSLLQGNDDEYQRFETGLSRSRQMKGLDSVNENIGGVIWKPYILL